jgi:hypothetical protein
MPNLLTQALIRLLKTFSDCRSIFQGRHTRGAIQRPAVGGYIIAALISGIAASLGNARVSVNASTKAGAYGIYTVYAGCLWAAYGSMAV